MTVSVRGGMGLGDALYVQAIVRRLVADGHQVKVHTAWGAVFSQLGPAVSVAPFRRDGVDLLAHYPARKRFPTKQFEDCAIQAGVALPVDLRLDWAPTDTQMLAGIRERAAGRPIVCLQLPRAPMGRPDGFGAELLPDCRAIQRIVDRIRVRAFILQIGAGEPLHRFTGIDMDLANRTSVRQLLDVASIADGFLGYVSFLVPLAESFDRPALLVWSRAGLESPRPFIRQITPQKILFRPSSRHVVDDDSPDRIDEAADAFLR